jgi:outer membrane protein OmpA-like peptidoglycan-associated protein
MELIMTKRTTILMGLLAVSIISGCNTVQHNSSLTAAHNEYSSAFVNPQVTGMAAVELKDASDSLNKADEALSKGESAVTVNHLAYIASQKVAIAQEVAKQKMAELAVTNAGANRNEVRLEARTLEADAAKQQAAMAQENAVQQTAALAAAAAKSEQDQTLIAKQEQQLKELNAKTTKRGLVITLGDVLFNINKAQLKSGGVRSVQKLADFLQQYPQHKVLIEGYTDSTGSNKLNQELSERRANAVKTALIHMGVSNERISTNGYGETFPVVSNDTAENRKLNRRVEIIISDERGNIELR